jgi:hypothetical protein
MTLATITDSAFEIDAQHLFMPGQNDTKYKKIILILIAFNRPHRFLGSVKNSKYNSGRETC